MSLSKECDKVSSSTSGDPAVSRGPIYPAELPADASDLVRFQWRYYQLLTGRVQSLFANQADLEKKQALNMIELKKALAAQMEAECNWRSSSLSVFPVLSDEDITSVLGLDLSAIGDLVLGLQPPATTQSATATAATTTTATAVRSTTTNPALPSTAATATTATAVRKPKLTVLSLRLANGSGSPATTKNKPTKPGKRFSARPVCRNPPSELLLLLLPKMTSQLQPQPNLTTAIPRTTGPQVPKKDSQLFRGQHRSPFYFYFMLLPNSL